MADSLDKFIKSLETILSEGSEKFGLTPDFRIERDEIYVWVSGQLSAPDRDPRWLKQQTQKLLSVIEEASEEIVPTSDVGYHKDYVDVTISIDTVENLKKLHKTGKLEEYTNNLKEFFLGDFIQRRKKRKKHELPDPSKSPGSYVNKHPRLTKQFKTDVSPDLADRVDEFRKASGKTKREIVEEALEAYLDKYDPI